MARPCRVKVCPSGPVASDAQVAATQAESPAPRRPDARRSESPGCAARSGATARARCCRARGPRSRRCRRPPRPGRRGGAPPRSPGRGTRPRTWPATRALPIGRRTCADYGAIRGLVKHGPSRYPSAPMMVPRLVALSLATAALLVGLGGDLAGGTARPCLTIPGKVERALLAPTHDEPRGYAGRSMRAAGRRGPDPARRGEVARDRGDPPRVRGSAGVVVARGPPGEASSVSSFPPRPVPLRQRFARPAPPLFTTAVVRPRAVHAS